MDPATHTQRERERERAVILQCISHLCKPLFRCGLKSLKRGQLMLLLFVFLELHRKLQMTLTTSTDVLRKLTTFLPSLLGTFNDGLRGLGRQPHASRFQESSQNR